MPTSKKPRKKISPKTPATDNVLAFEPDTRGVEKTMENMFGAPSKDPLDEAQFLMYEAWESISVNNELPWLRRR
jgi:hypothetical protein